MSIFDSLKRQAESSIKREASKAVRGAVGSAVQSVGKGRNRSEGFTFSALPANVVELRSLPEASLDSAFKTTALTILALCCYEADPSAALEMLDFLKGPAEVSTYEKQFIQERLRGKEYKARSFFAGATPDNGYQPTTPYTIMAVRPAAKTRPRRIHNRILLIRLRLLTRPTSAQKILPGWASLLGQTCPAEKPSRRHSPPSMAMLRHFPCKSSSTAFMTGTMTPCWCRANIPM